MIGLHDHPTSELFRLPMQHVLAATRAELLELKPVRIVTAVLLRGVVAILAFRARQRNHRANVF